MLSVRTYQDFREMTTLKDGAYVLCDRWWPRTTAVLWSLLGGKR